MVTQHKCRATDKNVQKQAKRVSSFSSVVQRRLSGTAQQATPLAKPKCRPEPEWHCRTNYVESRVSSSKVPLRLGSDAIAMGVRKAEQRIGKKQGKKTDRKTKEGKRTDRAVWCGFGSTYWTNPSAGARRPPPSHELPLKVARELERSPATAMASKRRDKVTWTEMRGRKLYYAYNLESTFTYLYETFNFYSMNTQSVS